MAIGALKRLISAFNDRRQESGGYEPGKARDHPKLEECVYAGPLWTSAVNKNADGFANVFFALL